MLILINNENIKNVNINKYNNNNRNIKNDNINK